MSNLRRDRKSPKPKALKFKDKRLKPGAPIVVWWATGVKDAKDNNIGRIIQVLPYTGRYPEFCDCVLRITSSGCRTGYCDMAYNSTDYAHDSVKYT